MFLARCDYLGRDVLIWASDLHGITNTDQGMIVTYRCGCGRMAELLTGSRSSTHLVLHAA